MKKKLFLLFGILASLIIISLLIWKFWPSKERKNQVSTWELNKIKKNINISVLRYDQDLFNVNFNNLSEDVQKLAEKYPPYLIEKSVCTNPDFLEKLKNYLTDPIIVDIYKQVQKLYPDLKQFESDYKNALAYYLNHFPNEKVPQIITIIPGIDLQMPSVYMIDQDLYLNLDMYLGPTCSHYSKLGIPKYISERFDKKYIIVDVFKKAIVYKHLPQQEPITFLEYMIIEGKKLYFTEMMLPNTPIKDIIGYSDEKFQWAETYYPNVWGYLIENNLLFSKEEDPVRRYIEEAPFSKPFGNPSPGRIGQFLGWKIVKEFMKNNPDVSLENLMKNTDLQQVLNKSSFKPVIKK